MLKEPETVILLWQSVHSDETSTIKVKLGDHEMEFSIF